MIRAKYTLNRTDVFFGNSMLPVGSPLLDMPMVTWGTGYRVEDNGDIINSKGEPHTGYVSREHQLISAERKAASLK
jgi:hypothetical protein